MSYTLNDIEKKVRELALQINAPQNLLPSYGRTMDGALPHIEVDEAGYLYYVVVERGNELTRKKFAELPDLLYEIFDHLTFSMAVRYELLHRINGEDFRKQLFAKQEELLGVLDINWEKRKKEDHQKVLQLHPFSES